MELCGSNLTTDSPLTDRFLVPLKDRFLVLFHTAHFGSSEGEHKPLFALHKGNTALHCPAASVNNRDVSNPLAIPRHTRVARTTWIGRRCTCDRPRVAAQGSKASGSGTTRATNCGRSESPCTNACATSGERWYTFSIFSGAMYSPCHRIDQSVGPKTCGLLSKR